MQTTNTDENPISSAFNSQITASYRRIKSRIYIKWDGHNWTEETANVLAHSGIFRLSRPGDPSLIPPGDVGQAQILLRNRQYRYSKLAGTGDTSLRTTILQRARQIKGVEVIIHQGFVLPDDSIEYVQIFQGVIYDWQEMSQRKNFMLYLRDMGYKYLQILKSTPLRKDYRIDEWITELANLAGVPSADQNLDVSLYTLPWAWLHNESPIEEIWAAAQADGGRIWFDHHGKLRFENSVHWLAFSSVWTLTADDFRDFQPIPDSESLATSIKVEWSPRRLSGVSVVYELDEKKMIPPGETITIDVKTDRPVYSYFTPKAGQDYQFVNAGGGDMNRYCTLTLDSSYKNAQSVRVSLTNNHGYIPALLIKFTLRGIPLVGGPTEEVREEISPAPLDYDRELPLSGNLYIQSDTQARALAKFQAARAKQVIPGYKLAGVWGIPQLELGDRLTFSDGRTVYTPRDGFITAMTWTCSEQTGYRQDITLLDAENLFEYSDYFVIGSTALGSVGRCWY